MESLEAWMSQLPDKERSICELALPGAHNAGASAVEHIPSATLAGYMGETLANSSMIQMLAKPVATAPALCQSESIAHLLRRGIRLLDLRLGLHNDEIHICHTVVCSTRFRTVLSEIREFLLEYPEELVVLLIKRDWEHRYFDTSQNWLRAQEMLIQEVDHMLMIPEDMKAPISQLVRENRRALTMLDLPPEVTHLCGVLITKGNLISSWNPNDVKVGDQMSRIKSWCCNGMILPRPGCLKVLELALPGHPRSSAPEVQAAFRDFLKTGPSLHVATKIDFPEVETLREIVKMNWLPKPTS